MKKSASLFIKNIGYNIIADFSNKIVNAVIILLLSHCLGVTDMGAYSVAHTFFNFGLLFSYWGFGTLLTRQVARDRNTYSKYLTSFTILRVLFAFVIIGVINIIIPHFGYIEQTQITIRIITIGILANTIVNLLYALFIAFEELKYLSIISVTIGVLKLIATYLVLVSGGSVVVVAVYFTVFEFLALLIGMGFAIHLLKGFKLDFDIKFSLDQVGKAFPFFLIALLVILDSRVEIIIISYLFNETIAGYYTAMITIMGGFSLFSEGIRNAVFPLLARYRVTAPLKLRELLLVLGKYITLITFPLSVNVFFLSGEIISLFFGSGYDLSVSFLQIVIWTFISHSLTVVTIRMLFVLDKEKLLAISLFVTSSLTLGLNFIFVPSIGPDGVAMVRLLTSVLLFFLCEVFLYRHNYQTVKPSVILRVAGASLCLFLVLYFFRHSNIFIAFFFGNAIYVAFLLLGKVIQKDDVLLWKGIVQSLIHS